ncbi:MAG: hypothetical protein QXM96_03905 [Candidatus Woesearchaeota archaeon]
MKNKFNKTIQEVLLKRAFIFEEFLDTSKTAINDDSKVEKLIEGVDYIKEKFDLSNLDNIFIKKPSQEYKLNYRTNLSRLNEGAKKDTKAWIIEEDGNYYLFKLLTTDHSHFYIHYVYGGKIINELPARVKKLIAVENGKYKRYKSGLLTLKSEGEAKLQAVIEHKNFSRVIKRNDERIIIETSTNEFKNSKFKLCVYLLAISNPTSDITISAFENSGTDIKLTNQKSTDIFTNKESKNDLLTFLIGNNTYGVKEPENALSAQASDDFSLSKAMLKRKNLHSLAENKIKNFL